MDKFSINGPCRVRGTIKLSGSKNASLPILAASILFDEPVEIKNLPKVFNDLLDTFALSTSECLESATAQKDKIVEAVGALGNQSFLIMVRSGLEFVRLWRQLCPNESRYPMLSAKLFEFEQDSQQIMLKNL